MLSQHPLVSGLIVAEERFFPIEEARLASSPCRMIVILKGLGMVANYLRDITHPIGCVIAPLMPCPIEHCHELAILSGRGILMTPDFPAKSIFGGPEIACYVLGICS